jgi:hypothetical protein
MNSHALCNSQMPRSTFVSVCFRVVEVVGQPKGCRLVAQLGVC